MDIFQPPDRKATPNFGQPVSLEVLCHSDCSGERGRELGVRTEDTGSFVGSGYHRHAAYVMMQKRFDQSKHNRNFGAVEPSLLRVGSQSAIGYQNGVVLHLNCLSVARACMQANRFASALFMLTRTRKCVMAPQVVFWNAWQMEKRQRTWKS